MNPKQRAFLAAFARCGSISIAARDSDVDRSSHYRWMRESADYAEAFKHATEEAAGVLEDAAIARAVEGWEEPVIYQGELAMEPVRDAEGRCVYVQAVDDQGAPLYHDSGDPRLDRLMKPLTIRKRSDALLTTLLKAWLPKKFRDNHHIEAEHTHTGLASLTDAELERIARGSSSGAAPQADRSE
jgi:transposase-like protein